MQQGTDIKIYAFCFSRSHVLSWLYLAYSGRRNRVVQFKKTYPENGISFCKAPLLFFFFVETCWINRHAEPYVVFNCCYTHDVEAVLCVSVILDSCMSPLWKQLELGQLQLSS